MAPAAAAPNNPPSFETVHVLSWFSEAHETIRSAETSVYEVGVEIKLCPCNRRCWSPAKTIVKPGPEPEFLRFQSRSVCFLVEWAMAGKSLQQHLLSHLKQGRLDLARRDLNKGASLFEPPPFSEDADQNSSFRLAQFQHDLWWAAARSPGWEGQSVTAGWDWLVEKKLPLERMCSLGNTHMVNVGNVLNQHPIALANWLEEHLNLSKEQLLATPFLPWRALQRSGGDPEGLKWLSQRGVPLENRAAWTVEPMVFLSISTHGFQAERQVLHLLANGVKPHPVKITPSTPLAKNGNAESPLGLLSAKYRASIHDLPDEFEKTFRRLWAALSQAGDDPDRVGPFGSPVEMIKTTPAHAWYEAGQRSARSQPLNQEITRTRPRSRP